MSSSWRPNQQTLVSIARVPIGDPMDPKSVSKVSAEF
jgi:hypothetical protein